MSSISCCLRHILHPVMHPFLFVMGVDHGGDRGDKSPPPEFGAWGLSPPRDFVMLQNFKHQITCITMKENVFFASTALSSAMHPPPQNSSQICAYAFWTGLLWHCVSFPLVFSSAKLLLPDTNVANPLSVIRSHPITVWKDCH